MPPTPTTRPFATHAGRTAFLATLGAATALGTWTIFFIAHLPGLAGLSSISFAAALWCFHNALATLARLAQWAGGGPLPLLSDILTILGGLAGPASWFLSPAFLGPLGWAVTAATAVLFVLDAARLSRFYRRGGHGRVAVVWLRSYLSGVSLLSGVYLFLIGPAVLVPTANAAAVLLTVMGLLDLLDWLIAIMQTAPSAPQDPSLS